MIQLFTADTAYDIKNSREWASRWWISFLGCGKPQIAICTEDECLESELRICFFESTYAII